MAAEFQEGQDGDDSVVEDADTRIGWAGTAQLLVRDDARDNRLGALRSGLDGELDFMFWLAARAGLESASSGKGVPILLMVWKRMLPKVC